MSNLPSEICGLLTVSGKHHRHQGHVGYCESMAILLCEDDDFVVAKPTDFYSFMSADLFFYFYFAAFVWIVILINVLICSTFYCRNSLLFCVFDTIILFEMSFHHHSECLVLIKVF